MERPTNQDDVLTESPMFFEDGSTECCTAMDVVSLGTPNDEMVENPVILENSSCVGDGNLEPYLGMEFESEEAARNFYNDYSKHVGFGIRINMYYRSRRDKTIISRQFVCSKEGFRRKRDSSDEKLQRSRPTTREGCKAMLTVRKRPSGKWYVAKFEKDHNHPLLSPNKVHFLRSHRRMPGSRRKLIDDFLEAETVTGDATNISREESGGICNIGFIENDHNNYTRKGRLSTLGIDTQTVLDYFKHMQASNPAFFYAIQVDNDQCIRNAFWVDGRSRIAYNYFYDMVTFDTTYKTNQYLVPFTPFVGVNHHRQPVLCGCAILSDESESTYVWLFKTWLEAMSDRHPLSMVTEQDKAIGAAVAQVFPRTRHCFSRWHIGQKVQEKLGYAHKNFGLDFVKCINKSETIEGFESAWGSLLDKYNLKENEWLQLLYADREQWVPLYLKDTFLVGTTIILENESPSSLFEGYVDVKTAPEDFFKQYEKALDNQCEKEIQMDFNTLNNKPTLRTPLPMEKQAADLYSVRLFTVFQEEFVQSLFCAVEDGAISGTFQVKKFNEHKAYTVTYNSSEMRASCNCKMFEFEGILCRHVLAIFKVKNVFMLPSHYILNRWTRDAKKGLDASDGEILGDCQESSTTRYNSLCFEAIKCAEEGTASTDVYKVALCAIREARKKIIAAKENVAAVPQNASLVSENNKENNIIKSSQEDNSTNHMGLRDHLRMKTRGCSQGTGHKEPLESTGRKEPPESIGRKEPLESTGRKEPPESTGRKEPPEKPMNKKRTCNICKVAGHDSRTCQMKGFGQNVAMGRSDPGVSFVPVQCSSQDNPSQENIPQTLEEIRGTPMDSTCSYFEFGKLQSEGIYHQ